MQDRSELPRRVAHRPRKFRCRHQALMDLVMLRLQGLGNANPLVMCHVLLLSVRESRG